MSSMIMQGALKPVSITVANFEKIVDAIAKGDTMARACKLVSVTPMQFLDWLDAHPSYQGLMVRAKSIGHDAMAESLLTIHEDIDDVAKARLAADNKKWLLARVASSKYGDKLEMNVNGSIDLNAALNSAQQRLQRDSAHTIDAEPLEYQSVAHHRDTDNKSDIDSLLD